MNKCGVWRWILTPIHIEIKARTFASRAGTVFDGRFNIIDIEAVDKLRVNARSVQVKCENREATWWPRS